MSEVCAVYGVKPAVSGRDDHQVHADTCHLSVRKPEQTMTPLGVDQVAARG